MTDPLFGRYHLGGRLLGYDGEGVLRAHDTAGRRYLVTITHHYEHRIARVRAIHDRYPSGFAEIVETNSSPVGDVLVEVEPPGRPAYELPPCSPSACLRLCRELGARLLQCEPGVLGIRPHLVYVDGGSVSGIATGYETMLAHNHPTRAGGYRSEGVGWFSSEQMRGLPLTRAHDGYVLAAMLRFWRTNAELVIHDHNRSMLDTMMDIALGRHLFHYRGPLHEIVDAGLGGATLDDVLAMVDAAAQSPALAALDEDFATRAAFIADIVAHPDDDGPRLVYADYLLERGDPRGDLIQLQLAGKPVDTLLADHGTPWSAHLRDLASEAFFERGFVAMIKGVASARFAQRRDALLAFGPLPVVG